MRMKVVGDDTSERGYQKTLLKGYLGWAEGVHPALGGKTGIPDTFFLYAGELFPVELKIGEIENGILKISDVRPAQIRWAKKFRASGGRSSFVCGVVIEGHWYSYMIPLLGVFDTQTEFKLNEIMELRSYTHLFSRMKKGLA